MIGFAQSILQRIAASSLAIVVVSVGLQPIQAEPAPDQAIHFYGKIKPLFAVRCSKCHSGETAKSDFNLEVSQRALAGGKSGKAAIVPGSSEQSELVRRISSSDPDEWMPPKGARLSAAEVALVKQWIDEGANWPERDDYWAFQPPRTIAMPHEAGGVHTTHPIDRFVVNRLAAAKIQPVAAAPKHTLIRRVYADLLGLPPSPEEAEVFLRDDLPDAYERLLDRLLSDPRYGERWARHWLDLARYGESDGYEDDKIRPHAWRYRDYVIRSFNADKPYDRFVQEQIAGAELWPDDPDAWIATGFARLGSWDGMSKEPAQQRQDFLNDATDVVGAVFLGVTIGCARCHDHKYDRITQKDYYRLQAFFAGVRRESRDVKGDLHDTFLRQHAYRIQTEEIDRLQRERQDLLRSAREELEREQEGRADQGGKTKIEDAAVMKKADSLHPGRLGKLNSQLKTLEAQRRLIAPRVDVVFDDGTQTPKTRILKGGELRQPGDEVEPGFIEAFSASGSTNSSGRSRQDGQLTDRRAMLARWLTSPQNPLFARVMVNRVWQHHFGVGIVATPSDFGRNGKSPTHPELLDWLARFFIEEGYSVKKLHRLIMTSATYRRGCSPDTMASSVDPENKLLWRMNRRRLEAEAIRDSILQVSGMLNPRMGGPGIYARLPKNVSVELPNNDKELSWGSTTEEENRCRSIYLFQRRSLTFPLMDVFDAAPMSQSCSMRAQTTVATQALALFNGEFCREAAGCFAERLGREAGEDAARQIRRAFELALTRSPTELERADALRFIETQAAIRKIDPKMARQAALVDFCHALLNANEFIYVD